MSMTLEKFCDTRVSQLITEPITITTVDNLTHTSLFTVALGFYLTL